MSDLSTGSRSERLDRALSALLTQTPEIEAAAVVSFDGLPMASALPAGMDEDRVAAMSAALLSLGERAAQGLGRGELSQVYIEGETGTVYLVSCDDEAVLVAVAAQGAKVGMMLFEVRRTAAAVADALRDDEPVAEPVHEPVAVVEPVALSPAGVLAAGRRAAPGRLTAAARRAVRGRRACAGLRPAARAGARSYLRLPARRRVAGDVLRARWQRPAAAHHAALVLTERSPRRGRTPHEARRDARRVQPPRHLPAAQLHEEERGAAPAPTAR
jgi:predicted regulator of Ras-like GTPase activity (Roadblock/LC7/MglB family)